MAVTIPANDRKASNLYFASIGLNLVINLAYRAVQYDEYSLRVLLTLVLILALTQAVLVGLGLGVRTGHQWVKWLFVVSIVWFSLDYFDSFSLYNMTPQTSLLFIGTVLRLWAAAIVARDLLRRPVAGESDSHPIS